MSLGQLSDLLWKERDLLERLLFRLEEEQLILAAGRTRWLRWSSDEVEAAAAAARDIEPERVAVSDAVAAEVGLPAGVTLGELAAAAPEPWGEVLRNQRSALVELLVRIDRVSSLNRMTLTERLQLTAATLGTPPPSGYGADGALQTGPLYANLVDGRL